MIFSYAIKTELKWYTLNNVQFFSNAICVYTNIYNKNIVDLTLLYESLDECVRISGR